MFVRKNMENYPNLIHSSFEQNPNPKIEGSWIRISTLCYVAEIEPTRFVSLVSRLVIIYHDSIGLLLEVIKYGGNIVGEYTL